jgi:hypothetical protein
MRFIWLPVFLLLAAGIYIYLNPGVKSQLLNQVTVPGQPGTVQAYKWQNARGEWQITDTLPPEGIEYERLEHRTDENILPVPPQLTTKK